MAKGKSNRDSADGTPSSLTSLLAPAKIITTPIVTAAPNLNPYAVIEPWGIESDQRYYNPTKRSAKPSALINAATRLAASKTHAIGFAQPSRVALCVRRNVRKEVLFARNLTRRGAGSKHRRKTSWSQIKC